MAEESLEDIIMDILKFAFIVGLIVGGFWLFGWFSIFTITEQKYDEVLKEINDAIDDTAAAAQSFNDAVALLDYDNAFETYADFKVQCEKVRVRYNNAPSELKSREPTYFTSLREFITTCQESQEAFSERLVALRVAKPFLG